MREGEGNIEAENTHLCGVPIAGRGGGSREVRRCRYWRCKRPFLPPKPHFYYCTWECRVADVGAGYARDYRGYQRDRDTHYDRGFWDGARARPADIDIPSGIWKGLIRLCHPDRYAQEPGLQALAGEVTRWLIEHRPSQN